jgi:hypothetical protein
VDAAILEKYQRLQAKVSQGSMELAIGHGRLGDLIIDKRDDRGTLTGPATFVLADLG